MANMSLSKAIEGFLISRAAEGYSQETLKIYRWALSAIVEFLDDPEIKSITSTELQSFYAYLQNDYIPRRTNGDTSPLKPRSIENAWTAIRSFYNWASSDLGVKKRPDLGLKRPRYQPAEITPFSPEEIKSLLKACERTRESVTNGRRAFSMRRSTASRDVAIIMLLLDTGLRVSECARLKLRDVNFETGEVFVAPFGTGRKTKSRHVYLGKATSRVVWRYVAERQDADPDTKLFVSRDNRPMDRNSIRLVLCEAGERAKVRRVHPHRFRHTFAVQYLRNGGDVFTLQRLLGHSSLEMVQHYLTLADTDSRSAHRKASPVDRWCL
jgi:integrase/recombinase XerD